MICSLWNCPRTSDGHCALCNPRPAFVLPPAPQYLERPVGCICPPTSEKTCENPTCPRSGPRISVAGHTATPTS